jgi:HSP20 family protein
MRLGSFFDEEPFGSLFGGPLFGGLGGMDRRFDMMRREMDEMMGLMEAGPDAPFRGEEDGGDVGFRGRRPGPYVYGCRVTMGPDGVPHVQEWGNCRPSRGPSLEDRQGGGVCEPLSAPDKAKSQDGPEVGEPASETPMYELGDCKDSLSLVAEIPGVDRKDIDLRLDDGVLRMDARGRHKSYTLTVQMPASVRLDRRCLQYRNGVLEIRLPKTAPPRAKKIEKEGDGSPDGPKSIKIN